MGIEHVAMYVKRFGGKQRGFSRNILGRSQMSSIIIRPRILNLISDL